MYQESHKLQGPNSRGSTRRRLQGSASLSDEVHVTRDPQMFLPPSNRDTRIVSAALLRDVASCTGLARPLRRACATRQ